MKTIRKHLDVYGSIIEMNKLFHDDIDSNSFKSKQKITGQTGNVGTKNVQIMTRIFK